VLAEFGGIDERVENRIGFHCKFEFCQMSRADPAKTPPRLRDADNINEVSHDRDNRDDSRDVGYGMVLGEF
jgi:hypothetical protein